MTAIEFLKNKGITKATCYTDSSNTYYINELAELMEEYAALRQPPVMPSLPNGKRVLAALKELSDCFTDEERKTMFGNEA